MKKWIGVLFMILCSFSIECFSEPSMNPRGTGRGWVSRVALNKYQVLNGIVSDSDIKRFYIITENCSLQGRFLAGVGDAREEPSRQVLCENTGRKLLEIDLATQLAADLDPYFYFPCCYIKKINSR